MPRWLDIPRDAFRRVAATLKQSERNTGRTSRRREPSARPVESGVRIEYTPNIDGDPDPGEQGDDELDGEHQLWPRDRLHEPYLVQSPVFRGRRSGLIVGGGKSCVACARPCKIFVLIPPR